MIEYKIVRSTRKSISICVSSENEIIVRCPRRMSESAIKTFLERKSGWLNKVVSENEAKLRYNNDVSEYRQIYICGERLPLILADKNEITPSAVYIKSKDCIKKMFSARFSDEFIEHAKYISKKINLYANGFSVRAYKRRWGCCDSKGKITFNYMLFMLPQSLQNYVIIHELCHTVYFNHSAEFWKLVSKFVPDYKYLRKQLKYFDFITNLY